MTKPERLYTEIRSSIDSGNKVFTAFLIGAVVWWVGNLLPYDFSELGGATPTSKLSILKSASNKANETCDRSMHNFSSAYAQSIVGRSACDLATPTISGPQLDDRDPNEERRREKIYQRLMTAFRTTGPAKAVEIMQDSIDTTVKYNSCPDTRHIRDRLAEVTVCKESRAELARIGEQIAKQSGFDMSGIRIPNIHPRWHPTIMVLIICIMITWLATIRRRVFRLTSTYMTTQPTPSDPVLLTLPWWLWPQLSAPLPDGPFLHHEFAPRVERQRAAVSFVIVAGIVAVMFASAIQTQSLLATFDIADVKAVYQLRSFSLFGSLPLDLAFIGSIFAASLMFFWMAEPPSTLRTQPKQSSRRDLLRASTFVGTVLVGAMLTPLLVARQKATALIVKSAHGVGLAISPRFRRRRRRFAKSTLESGWYQLNRTEKSGNANWIAHFVKPANVPSKKRGKQRKARPRRHQSLNKIMRYANMLRPTSPKKLHRARTSDIPAGRIAASWRMKVARLVKIPDDQIKNALADSRERLNSRAYSEGIETVTIRLWKAGKFEDATATIMSGLRYANGRSFNIRLYDLSAGLLVRSGKVADLETLTATLKLRVARINTLLTNEKRRLIETDNDITAEKRLQSRGRADVAKTAPVTWSENEASAAKLKMTILRYQTEARHIEFRIRSWGNPNSNWAKKWAKEKPHQWSGIDI